MLAFCGVAVASVLHADPVTPTRPTPNFDVAAPLWNSGDYKYDGEGNVIEIGDDRYDYDLAGRVIAGTAYTTTHANSQTFDYDVYGNLKTVLTRSDLRPATNGPWVASLLTIDSATNRILKPCGPAAGCASLVYDPAGNVTADGATTYVWDLLGNLQQLTTTGRKERYLYDANNERIASVTVDSATHEYRRYTIRGAGQQVLREATDEVSGATHTWKWNKDYVHREGTLLAAVTPADPGATAEETNHFHVDHLRSARVITDAHGYRRALHTFYPYGIEAPGSDFDRERMKFSGHERDFADTPANDLDYMHARFYRPVWGRFLSVDPSKRVTPGDTQSWNEYTYARGNPVKYIDPDGREILVAFNDPVFKMMVRTAMHAQGRADFQAIHASPVKFTYKDEHIEQTIAGKLQTAGTLPNSFVTYKTATTRVDTCLITAEHADPTGDTTIAHENHHNLGIVNNVPWADIVATDSNGVAETYGATVSSSPTDMTEAQAEAFLRELLKTQPAPQEPTAQPVRMSPDEEEQKKFGHQ